MGILLKNLMFSALIWTLRHLPLRAFARNEAGNFAMILGICLAPLLGFIGLGVDYNHLWKLQGNLQFATDAAAVEVMRNEIHGGFSGKPKRSSDEVALATIRTNFRPQIDSGDIEVMRLPSKVIVRATHEADTFILGLFGFHTKVIKTESQVSSGARQSNQKLSKLMQAQMGKANRQKRTRFERELATNAMIKKQGCVIGATLRSHANLSKSQERELRAALRKAKAGGNGNLQAKRLAQQIEKGMRSGNPDRCLP